MNGPTAHTALSVKKRLRALRNPTKAKLLAGYFKTGKGQYGEGDSFLGITVPVQRTVAHQFIRLPLLEIAELLSEPVHECRFTALQILVAQFVVARKNNDTKTCSSIANFYCKHAKYINNWDLVDTSASYILGAYLYEFNTSRAVLYAFARSKDLWKRRISIISTFYFINKKDFADSIKIAEMLMDDGHDLIHKAVGWMLREIGKRDTRTLVQFLRTHAHHMPRTMLRYAIEKFDQEERQKYLNMV